MEKGKFTMVPYVIKKGLKIDAVGEILAEEGYMGTSSLDCQIRIQKTCRIHQALDNMVERIYKNEKA